MTAICENEIVTLRGEVCLVRQLPKLPLIAKIAEIEKQNLEPQDTKDTEANLHRGETRRRFAPKTQTSPQITTQTSSQITLITLIYTDQESSNRTILNL